MKTYEETTQWLFQQFPSYQNIGANAYKPSLANILKLCDVFGNPQEHLKFIHVAGTNGKGSTCSMLASILTESGYKTGLFTSPHIKEFTERIRINGIKISEKNVIEKTNQIKDAQLDFEPSFFEITFLMALIHFKEQKCDICVIETGLGGRLDATNIITPLISVITNISIEHTQFLGNTITSIATEKAGIIKTSVPVIIGERNSESTPIFNSVALKNNAPILFAEDFLREIPNDFPLLGEYQIKNFNLVKLVLSTLQDQFPLKNDSISNGLKNLHSNTGFMGRMQIVSEAPLTIFDVSHNEAGIKETLVSILQLNKGKLFIVYGTSSDKDISQIFELFPENARYFFTQFSNERSATVEQLNEFASRKPLDATFFTNPHEALKSAQNIANKEDTILVFGSFFLISDFF